MPIGIFMRLAVALIFALFALAIAYFGASQQGEVGFRSIDVTIASLVSLVIYLVPLIALILGYDAIVGERERGSLELMLSMPITRFEILLGKYLGLAAALASATAIGFGAGLLPLANELTVRDGFHYAGFVGSAILMGLAFLSMSMLVSVVAFDRVRASGVAIALWFFFVLIFDLLLEHHAVKRTGRVKPRLLRRRIHCHLAAGGQHGLPARGGNPALKDEELKAAVDFMVSKAL